MTEGNSEIIAGMYGYATDSGTPIAGYSFTAADQTSTFTAANSSGFGLQRGNSIVVFATDGTLLGKFYVKNLGDPDVLEAVTERDLTAGGFTVGLAGRTGFEDNDAPTGATGKNVGVRGVEPLTWVFFLEEDTRKSNPSAYVLRMVVQVV